MSAEYRKERVEEEVAKARESRIGPADDERFRALHTDPRFKVRVVWRVEETLGFHFIVLTFAFGAPPEG